MKIKNFDVYLWRWYGFKYIPDYLDGWCNVLKLGFVCITWDSKDWLDRKLNK